MKGITLCAECTYYDKKKHRCKRGASKERFAIDPFYDDCPLPDVVEVDRLGRVGRLMLPYKGCPRGPIGRLGMAGGKTQDKKAILIEELCCMDIFEDVDGNVWRPVQEEVLQEVLEMLRNMEETVHCKDCRYCIPVAADNAEYELCIVDDDVFPVSVQKQHFCSRGKRKEG